LAFAKNVATLAKEKPIKQALAIAYSIQREVQKADAQLAGQTGIGATLLEGGFNTGGKKRSAAQILGELAKACPGNPMIAKAVLSIEELGRMHHEPTEAQKHAGNYRMGHTRIHGLEVTIETAKGGTRKGVTPEGKAWESTMAADYGYLLGYQGADKDHLDCFVGPVLDSKEVHLVHQHDPRTGKFDELKCCLGFAHRQDAVQAYLGSYQPGWKGMGRVQTMSVPEFIAWLDTQPRTIAKSEGATFLVTRTGKLIL
jgi:hypothetical protein